MEEVTAILTNATDEDEDKVSFQAVQIVDYMYITRILFFIEPVRVAPLKWSASFRWSSLYCPMRNTGEMTNVKMRPTLPLKRTKMPMSTSVEKKRN